MIRVGILGATGFVGAELIRLLVNHPGVEISFLDSRSYKDIEYSTVYPNLRSYINDKCISVDLDSDLDNVDLIFCALPHGLSQEPVKKALEKGKKVIDLSADFRIKDADVYADWYGVEHKAKDDLESAIYGLSEIYTKEIKEANLIANPGCYPTSIIIPLYPLLKENVINDDVIIVDSKSGVSGAGRTPSEANLYALCNENIKAYSLGKHRHTPEIEQELSTAASRPVMVQFTPHLTPMTRGILSTIYIKNTKYLDYDDIKSIYDDYYKDKFFIRILNNNEFPQTKAVYGSNFCDIGFTIDKRTNTIIIVSAIDNLVKGAAGQAIQNMNIMFGLKENEGLNIVPIWP